ncbi:MAG: type II toxin-antitoxin system RelE/ParE family toxin [Caldilineaceae bacterium]
MKKYQLDVGLVIGQIDRLPGHIKSRVKKEIAQLALNPRPEYARELRNRPTYYRIRIDAYRIVYRVEDDLILIVVLKVGRKKGPEFYDNLD